MAVSMDAVSKMMEEAGIPGRDLYDRPASGKSFPDGCQYRIEMSGVEGPKVLEALINERRKRNVPVHRLVSFCQGGTLYDDAELKDFAQMAAEEKMEVIAIPGPRNAWDIGRQFVTADGQRCGGLNHRGSDEIRKVITDMLRMYEIGFRGLCSSTGAFWLWSEKCRSRGTFRRISSSNCLSGQVSPPQPEPFSPSSSARAPSTPWRTSPSPRWRPSGR